MTCYHPLKGYWSRDVDPGTGRRRVVFDVASGYRDRPITIPCGQCIGCRLERSRQWAIRCVHEASLWRDNCFLTLTYDDNNIPEGGTLVLSDLQRFMKRLRKRYGAGIRFFACGEYGSNLERPHYHAVLFNHDFSDKTLFRVKGDTRLYISDALSELWPFGYSTIGDVTFESAAYVARYVLKKMNGAPAEAHYGGRRPEFVVMSRRPGVGAGWWERFSSDVWPDDFVVIRGREMKPPRYYERLYELQTAGERARWYELNDIERLKVSRVRKARRSAWNATPERLKVREQVQNAKLSRFKREVEE